MMVVRVVPYHERVAVNNKPSKTSSQKCLIQTSGRRRARSMSEEVWREMISNVEGTRAVKCCARRRFSARARALRPARTRRSQTAASIIIIIIGPDKKSRQKQRAAFQLPRSSWCHLRWGTFFAGKHSPGHCNDNKPSARSLRWTRGRRLPSLSMAVNWLIFTSLANTMSNRN